MSIRKYDSQDFNKEILKNLLGNRKVFTVFSTFGEREADLVFKKIKLFSEELKDLNNNIILSHRRIDADKMEETEKNALEASSDTDILICNNYSMVPDMDNEKGKGADMRRALYFINKERKASADDIVLFLDTDVVTEYFGIHFFLGLIGALIQDKNDFAKSSFWREMGRVKKYVAQPLFSVLKGDNLEQLSELAYPLSGEVAGTIDFFNSVHFWQIYGVETGINIDAVINDYNIADVNLGKYDHEHNSDVNIQKMSFGIIRTYMKQLVDYGYIELKSGCSVSDQFNAEYIDEMKQRQQLDFMLEEKKYNPLKTLLN